MTIIENNLSNRAYIEGTASELTARGVIINGQPVDPVSLGQLAKHGIIQTIGKAEKVPGKRGKVGNVYRVQQVPGFLDFVA